MRGQCEIATCSSPKETRKIHEDFECLHHNICWECGDKILKSVGNNIDGFKAVTELIHKELE